MVAIVTVRHRIDLYKMTVVRLGVTFFSPCKYVVFMSITFSSFLGGLLRQMFHENQRKFDDLNGAFN